MNKQFQDKDTKKLDEPQC